MNETTTIARTPRAAQVPDTDVLFQLYRLGPFNLRHRPHQRLQKLRSTGALTDAEFEAQKARILAS